VAANCKKDEETLDIIAAVATDNKEDRRASIQDLLLPMEFCMGLSTTSCMTILAWLKSRLGGCPNSSAITGRKVNQDLKRLHNCHFLPLYSRPMLDRIITVDQTLSGTKKQSKQWLEKGKSGPIKARIHASWT
jgi:hypothetical protein